jgi:hypothetical protein
MVKPAINQTSAIMAERVYTEKEVAHLIRRAVELDSERSSAHTGDKTKGLTISDLEKIAADSGIDPALMKKAAEELEQAATLPGTIEPVKVSKTEIVSEQWIDARVSDKIIDELITELNHRFGTSEDDISWWDNFWDNYAGKAKIKKTSTSAEWRYTDEMEMYTTCVLMQQRGEKFRIRVSKRQGYNLSWYSNDSHFFLSSAVLAALVVPSAVLGFFFLDITWQGAFAGLMLSLLVIPAAIYYSRQKLEKHKQEVAEIADNLVQQTYQLIDLIRKPETKKKTNTREPDIQIIEIDSSDKESKKDNPESFLRNNLRE